jgi:serine/threonine protein phosphatase PrpC
MFQAPLFENKIFPNISKNQNSNNIAPFNNSNILNNQINFLKAPEKSNKLGNSGQSPSIPTNNFAFENNAFAGNSPNFNVTKNKFLMNFNPPNLVNPQDRIIAFGQDRSENNFKKTLRKPAISSLIQNNSLSILNPNPVMTNNSFTNSLRGAGAANANISNSLNNNPNLNSVNGIEPSILYGLPFTALKNQLPASNYNTTNTSNTSLSNNNNNYNNYTNYNQANYNANSETNSINSTTTNSKESSAHDSNLYVKDACSVKEFAYKEDPNYKNRGAMEDMGKCLDKYLNNPDLGLFTLYDGHGGAEIAHYLRKRLPELFAKILIPLNNKFETEDLNYDIENSINILFNKLDDEIKLTSESEYMGSTAVMVLVCKEKDYISPLTSRKVLYCANVGDSRCVLVSNFGVKRLSYDHKASDVQEINRVNGSGGVIFNGRVFGQLIITRAFGDHSLKRYGVIATPHISKHFVSGKDKYLVLASDGVWDVIMDEELLKLSQSVINADEFSKLIIKTSLLRGTQDNLSCIVIKL